jgi:hypothetical protein
LFAGHGSPFWTTYGIGSSGYTIFPYSVFFASQRGVPGPYMIQ